MLVQFYFGLGSRYSYLASTQIDDLAAETAATFEWRPLNSRDLIEQAGSDPFRSEVRRGQYDPAYRTTDATRWAAYYGVPYREPDWSHLNSRRTALACVAAQLSGRGEAFARGLFNVAFGPGGSKVDDASIAATAQSVGLEPAQLMAAIESADTLRQHELHLRAAAAAGAFGVPTFVLDTGELFWGQDRLPLLRRRLLAEKQKRPT